MPGRVGVQYGGSLRGRATFPGRAHARGTLRGRATLPGRARARARARVRGLGLRARCVVHGGQRGRARGVCGAPFAVGLPCRVEHEHVHGVGFAAGRRYRVVREHGAAFAARQPYRVEHEHEHEFGVGANGGVGIRSRSPVPSVRALGRQFGIGGPSERYDGHPCMPSVIRPRQPPPCGPRWGERKFRCCWQLFRCWEQLCAIGRRCPARAGAFVGGFAGVRLRRMAGQIPRWRRRTPARGPVRKGVPVLAAGAAGVGVGRVDLDGRSRARGGRGSAVLGTACPGGEQGLERVGHGRSIDRSSCIAAASWTAGDRGCSRGCSSDHGRSAQGWIPPLAPRPSWPGDAIPAGRGAPARPGLGSPPAGSPGFSTADASRSVGGPGAVLPPLSSRPVRRRTSRPGRSRTAGPRGPESRNPGSSIRGPRQVAAPVRAAGGAPGPLESRREGE